MKLIMQASKATYLRMQGWKEVDFRGQEFLRGQACKESRSDVM